MRKQTRVVHLRLSRLIKHPMFIWIAVVGHLAIILGALGIHHFEAGVNPNVTSGFDSFYLAITTVTTVGYGDISPVTTGGKITAMGLMISGSLFLWSFAGMIAGAIIAPDLAQLEQDILNEHRTEKRNP